MSSDLDDLIAQGYVTRFEASFSGVGASGVVYLGVVTGSREVVVLGRGYSSSESVLTVELFEATHSGGTPARQLNRRLKSTRAAPMTALVGVTPGALGSAITGLTLRANTSTGSASLQVSADDSKLYLKENTSYVLRFTNGGSNSATISAGIDVRPTVGGISVEN